MVNAEISPDSLPLPIALERYPTTNLFISPKIYSDNMPSASNWARQGFFLILLLVVTGFVFTPAAAGPERGEPCVPEPGMGDACITNLTFNGSRTLPEYEAGPTPVELFHTELDQAALPGPRYMAFGPSVIALSIDPRLLATCFAIALIALVIWFVSFRDHNGEQGGTGRPG